MKKKHLKEPLLFFETDKLYHHLKIHSIIHEMSQGSGDENIQMLTPQAKPEGDDVEQQNVPSLSPPMEEKDVKKPTLSPAQKPVSPKEQSIPDAPHLDDENSLPPEPEPEPQPTEEPKAESKPIEDEKPEEEQKDEIKEEVKEEPKEKPQEEKKEEPKAVEPALPPPVPVRQAQPQQQQQQQNPPLRGPPAKEKPDVANLDEIEIEEEEIEDEVLKGIEPTIDSIPNNNHAKLMYYLFCVDNVLHLSKKGTNLGRYIKYRDYNLTQAERSKLIVWATVLHPMILEKKCILHSDEICGNDNDILYARRSDVAEYLSQGNDEKDSEYIIVNDIKVKISEVLIYKSSWLDLYYNNPQSIIGRGNKDSYRSNLTPTSPNSQVVIQVEEEQKPQEEQAPPPQQEPEKQKEDSDVLIPIDDNNEEVAGVHIQKVEEERPANNIDDIEEIPSSPPEPKQEPIKPKDKKKKKKHYKRPPKKTFKYAGVMKCNRCCTCCCNILRPLICFVGLAFIELIGIGEILKDDSKYNTTDFNQLAVSMVFALLGIIIEFMEACISCRCKLLDSVGYRVYCVVNFILFILFGVFVAVKDNITPVYIPFLVAVFHLMGACWVGVR